MSVNTVLPPPQPIAYREYGLLGRAVVINSALKYGFVAAVALALGMGFVALKMSNKALDRKPLIVRVDEAGRAEAVDYKYTSYTPQEAEIRYFLTQFTVGYYSRNPVTLERAFPEACYFLSDRLLQQEASTEGKAHWIGKFLASGEDAIDVDVKNPAIDASSAPIYRARVDFDKVYRATGGVETKRERWVEQTVFKVDPKRVIQNPVLVRYNPLGFSIEYVHADKAF